MVNSASASLAEFKSQRMGSLLNGISSKVDAPSILGTSLSDSASTRLARSAPKRSSTAFMDQIRQSGKKLHNTQMVGFQAQQQRRLEQQRQQQQQGGSAGGGGYSLAGAGKPQPGGARGQYGLTIPAAAAFNQLSNAYAKRWGGGLSVVSGGRTYQEQAHLYNLYRSGRGNLAAPPGTSLHESGLAVDLGGPIQNSGSAQHAWLRANAAQFGWYWVGSTFSQVEPWHWEYRPRG